MVVVEVVVPQSASSLPSEQSSSPSHHQRSSRQYWGAWPLLLTLCALQRHKNNTHGQRKSINNIMLYTYYGIVSTVDLQHVEQLWLVARKTWLHNLLLQYMYNCTDRRKAVGFAWVTRGGLAVEAEPNTFIYMTLYMENLWAKQHSCCSSTAPLSIVPTFINNRAAINAIKTINLAFQQLMKIGYTKNHITQ